jgi:hypothetical protein
MINVDNNLAYSLLHLKDDEFLEKLYLVLCGRVPDEEGRLHYMHRLKSGIAKTKIVSEIRTSPESQKYILNMPSLDRAISVYKLYKIPVIGKCIENLFSVNIDRAAVKNFKLWADNYYAEKFHLLNSDMYIVKMNLEKYYDHCKKIEARVLERQEAIFMIQRDSFENELQAIRKIINND